MKKEKLGSGTEMFIFSGGRDRKGRRLQVNNLPVPFAPKRSRRNEPLGQGTWRIQKCCTACPHNVSTLAMTDQAVQSVSSIRVHREERR
jgi:hypothetical protein